MPHEYHDTCMYVYVQQQYEYTRRLVVHYVLGRFAFVGRFIFHRRSPRPCIQMPSISTETPSQNKLQTANTTHNIGQQHSTSSSSAPPREHVNSQDSRRAFSRPSGFDPHGKDHKALDHETSVSTSHYYPRYVVHFLPCFQVLFVVHTAVYRLRQFLAQLEAGQFESLRLGTPN